MASMQDMAAEATRLAGEGKYLEAAAQLDKILEMNEEIAEVHSQKGVVLSQGGKLEEAVDSFDRATELKPSLVGAHFNKGSVLKQLGKHQDAVAAFRRATEEDPSMASAWSELACELNEMGDFETALSVVTEGIERSEQKDTRLRSVRILTYFRLNRPGDALEDVEACIKQTPLESVDDQHKEIYCLVLHQAGVNLKNAGKAAEAESYFQRVVKAMPTPDNLYTLGICLLELGKEKGAVEALERAKMGDANNWRIPVALGAVYMQQKKFKDAANTFESALAFKEASGDPDVNFNYAVALLKTGRDSEAIPPLEAVVSADPENWVAIGLLGTLYLQNQDYDNAIDMLEKASKHNPDDSSLFYNLGYANLMKERPKEALESFEKALEIDPKSEQAKAAVGALKADVEAGTVMEESPTPAPEKKQSLFKRLSTKRSSQAPSAPGSMNKNDITSAIKAAQMKNAGAMPNRTQKEMERLVKDARTPLERAQALLAPQRPGYLRRPSMECIQGGLVGALSTVYDEITGENLIPSY
mmetsp:Transcript_16041/g.34740  ORF Transcript_16041/g.34740 Transcript_16041/m.34740 type:complete len:529 (-) Transcript_16041:19-1605(-)